MFVLILSYLFHLVYSVPLPINQTTIITPQNDERNIYGLPNFIYDDDLATLAQGITNNCNWTMQIDRNALQANYAQMKGQTYNGAPSQTIGITLVSATGQPAAPSWLNNKIYWNCLNNTCVSGQQCDAYTQIIWETSVYIGCGLTGCTNTGPYWEFLICFFNPAGNWLGQHPFGSNTWRCLSPDPPSSPDTPSSPVTPSNTSPSSNQPSGNAPGNAPSNSGIFYSGNVWLGLPLWALILIGLIILVFLLVLIIVIAVCCKRRGQETI